MKMIEQWVEEMDEVVLIPEFDISGHAVITEYFNQNPGHFERALFGALQNLARPGWKESPLFAVKGAEAVLMLDLKGAETAILRCLQYFESEERYEACTRLLEIREELRRK
jgi:hypothetical protein